MHSFETIPNMFNIDFAKIGEILRYIPEEPLIFNSSFFLFFLTIVLLIYAWLKKSERNERFKIIFMIVASFYFYYKTNGFYFLLILFIAFVDYFAAHLIHNAPNARKKRMWLIASLTIDLGVLCYFKYTNFFFDLFYELANKPFTPFSIMLPVGISFFIFQSLSYVIDIYRGKVVPLYNILDYIFYISFFPQLVAGPIVRAKDFIPQIHKPFTMTKKIWNEAFILILTGLFKKAIISDYISTNFVDRIFDYPELYSGVENLFAVYGYAAQIYCDFSGYSDMAIGFALLFGYRFNINFDLPYKSATITEFWRRWHISLSAWLKDYLYIALGGNRKGKIRTYVNLMITMLLGGLWHGASLRFILWGGLHGLYLVVHKWLMGRFPDKFQTTGEEMTLMRRIVGIFITFHLVCFGWIFFRAESMEKATTLLSQIFGHFRPGVFIPFLQEYAVIVFLIVLCFAMQFLPASLTESTRQKVANWNWMVKAAVTAALIILIAQVKSSEIQPFIYFQF